MSHWQTLSCRLTQQCCELWSAGLVKMLSVQMVLSAASIFLATWTVCKSAMLTVALRRNGMAVRTICLILPQWILRYVQPHALRQCLTSPGM